MTTIIGPINSEYIKLYPEEVARFIEQLPDQDTKAIVASLSVDEIVSLVMFANIATALNWIKLMPFEKLVQIIGSLSNDYTALLMRRLAKEKRASVLEKLPRGKKRYLEQTLDFPAQSIGMLTDPVVLSMSEDSTVGEALIKIRDSMDYQHDLLYVVNRSQKLVGLMSLREFIRADANQLVKAVMRRPPLVLLASANRSLYVDKIKASHYEELPVVDGNNHLVGILRKSTIEKFESEESTALKEDSATILISMAELFWHITSVFFPASNLKNESRRERLGIISAKPAGVTRDSGEPK